jgi:predicted nucleic acid-binding protein
MPPVVLDTDVLSYIAKADTRAAHYEPLLADRQLCVCFQTIAELRLWVIVKKWGAVRRREMDAFLDRFVILPYDSEMAQHWADLTAHRRQLGRPIDCGDAWIAASALRHRASLLTHNLKDYAEIPGLNLLLPNSGK